MDNMTARECGIWYDQRIEVVKRECPNWKENRIIIQHMAKLADIGLLFYAIDKRRQNV